MPHVLVLGLALLVGVVAGLRAFTAPAVVSWGAFLGWIDLDGKWSHWMGHPVTVAILTCVCVAELVADQLPRTLSRKAAPQFVTRLLTGAFAGAVLGSAFFHTFSAAGAGMIGAVLGTLAGYEVRTRLVAARPHRAAPIALLEDAVAVLGGLAVVYVMSLV